MAARLIMMRGLPASGKSTRAKELLAEFGSGNAKRVCMDDLRAMLDDGKWSKHNEQMALSIQDSIVERALTEGKHAIVDNTHLPAKHEVRLREVAKKVGAEFELLDFTHVSVEECLARDRKRQNWVGSEVILRMYYDHIAPKIPVVDSRPGLTECVIVDLDGTLADLNGRNPYDASTCYQDKVRSHVLEAAKALAECRKLILLSGRSDKHRGETERWLRDYCNLHNENGYADYLLFMRKDGDCRKDAVIKREIFEAEVVERFNVSAIIDDRPQVIRLWRELGFTDRVFDVGTGREF